MALRFIDSCGDHYDVAGDMDDKWTTNIGAATDATGRIDGINGHAAHFGATAGKRIQIDAQQTWIVGFAFRCINGGNGNMTFLEFLDSAVAHIDFRRVSSTGQIVVTRNGTTLVTSTTVFNIGDWHYFEAKVKIDDTVGQIRVQVDGVADSSFDFDGDTRNAGNATANIIGIKSTNATPASQFDFDDVYICDATGSAPTNTFLGDSRVEALFPNGNGNSSQLLGSDGNSTDNYLLVDDTEPDDDTTYVESSTVTDKDTYAMTDCTPTTGTVYGVQPIPYAKKTDAGTRKICSVARLSGTEVDSADKVLTNIYKFYADVRETKPGGGAWSLSDVNSAEFGIKVTA